VLSLKSVYDGHGVTFLFTEINIVLVYSFTFSTTGHLCSSCDVLCCPVNLVLFVRRVQLAKTQLGSARLNLLKLGQLAI
jgi:hypothetical protein